MQDPRGSQGLIRCAVSLMTLKMIKMMIMLIIIIMVIICCRYTLFCCKRNRLSVSCSIAHKKVK